MNQVLAIAARFAEGVAVLDASPFGDGHINDTYLVQTSGQPFVLQRINQAVFGDPAMVAGNIDTVRAHVRRVTLPKPMPTTGGDMVTFDGRDCWRAWARVAKAAPTRERSPSTVGSAAYLLGQLHADLVDLDPATVSETLPGFHDPTRRLAALRRAIDADPCGRVGGAEQEIRAALAAAHLAACADDVVARVPRRVAHNDAKLDNFLFRDGEAVCIVDLDTVMPTAFFWDVGDLVRSAATTSMEDDLVATVDRSLYDAVVAGYRRGVSGLAAAEVQAIDVAGAIVTYEQAVRFLTDWIAGDVYYRTSRPGQNLDRARNQLQLLSALT
jgi:Ser/Thr protein kinase RdoA (MazF antagonist)